MKVRFSSNVLLTLAIGFGLLTGWAALPWLNGTASTISMLFLRLLKLLSLPIIFFAITATLSGMRDLAEARTLGRRILQYTLITTILASLVALGLYLSINPTRLAHIETLPAEVNPSQPTYLSFLLTAIPENFVQVFAEGHVIGIVFMALALGIGTLLLPTHQKETLNQFFSSFFSLLLKLTKAVIAVMPLAIWAFVALLIKELKEQDEAIHTLWLYLACVVGANLIQGFLVLPLLLKFKKISPVGAFKAVTPALSMAFFSKSSNATLPLTMQCIEGRGKVSKRVSGFALPLCTVINMNGCAAFILITSLFVATLSGHIFGPFDYVAWVFIATLAAIGNAGVPMGCYFLTSACLVGMDVPLYMMGLILPFYTIIDMVETALNVWSDTCVTMIVDKESTEPVVVEGAERLA